MNPLMSDDQRQQWLATERDVPTLRHEIRRLDREVGEYHADESRMEAVFQDLISELQAIAAEKSPPQDRQRKATQLLFRYFVSILHAWDTSDVEEAWEEIWRE